MNDDCQRISLIRRCPPEGESRRGRVAIDKRGYLQIEALKKTSHQVLLTPSSLEKNEIVVRPRRRCLGYNCCSPRHHYQISSIRAKFRLRSAADYRGYQERQLSFILPLYA